MTSRSTVAPPSPMASTPELMELAEAAGLGPVVPEHRAEVIEPHGLGLVVETVLQIGAADGRRALRAERHLLAAAVLETVHLLLDDVRFLSHRACEESGALEDRSVDPGVAKRMRGPGERRIHERPVTLAFGKNIGCASGRLLHRGSPNLVLGAPIVSSRLPRH